MSSRSTRVDGGVAADRALERLPEELAREPRYRRTVAHLVETGGRVSTSELIRQLGERSPRTPDTEQYREIHCWLHRTAIPTLRQFGVVEYDHDRGELALGPNVTESGAGGR